jgi:hypothetical protein
MFVYVFFRKPDFEVDPENVRVREDASSNAESVILDNRFGESTIEKKKCGVNFSLEDRIVGGELCALDKYSLNDC